MLISQGEIHLGRFQESVGVGIGIQSLVEVDTGNPSVESSLMKTASAHIGTPLYTHYCASAMDVCVPCRPSTGGR